MSESQNFERIIADLQSANKITRSFGYVALTRLKEPESIAPFLLVPLLKMLGAGNDSDMRLLAVQLLGQFKYKEALEPLLIALDTDDVELKRAILYALGYVDSNDERVFATFLEATRSENIRIAEPAFIGLAKSKDERALPVLLAAVKNNQAEIRASVVNVLYRFQTEEVFQTLLDLLKHETDSDILENVVSSLGPFRDKRVIEPLLAVLKEKVDDEETSYGGVRIQASEVLSQFKEARLFEPLFQLLNDPDDHVPPWAIDALGMLGDGRAVEPLVAILNDKAGHLDDRRRAAQNLGDLNNSDDSVIKALLAVLDEEEDWNGDTVGQGAAYSLGKLVLSETHLVALLVAAKSADLTRRSNAIIALCTLKSSLSNDSRVSKTLKEALKNVVNFNHRAVYELEKHDFE